MFFLSGALYYGKRRILMREQLITLGCRIRDARKKQKITLQQLAEQTGLTAGLLSKIENFRALPSLPVLLEIAKALNIDLARLFEGLGAVEKKPWLCIRADESYPIERDSGHGLSYRMIFETPLKSSSMQLMLVTDGDGHETHPVTSEAEQLLYILSGTLHFQVGADKIRLSQGDLLFFDGSISHGPVRKEGGEPEHFSMLAFYFLHGTENGESSFT